MLAMVWFVGVVGDVGILAVADAVVEFDEEIWQVLWLLYPR